MSKRSILKPGFSIVCVWPGVDLGNYSPADFEAYMASSDGLSTRVQYLETIQTKPDQDSNGNPVAGTGGRNDLIFAVHSEDVGKFAIPRLAVGIRWLEDVLAACNYHSHIYPDYIFGYLSSSDGSAVIKDGKVISVAQERDDDDDDDGDEILDWVDVS